MLRRTLLGSSVGVFALSAAGVSAQQPAPASGSVHVFVRLEVLPGKDRAAAAVLQPYVARLRQALGSIRSELLRETGMPVYTLVEVWRDAAAYEANLAAAGSRLRAELKPLMGAPPDVRDLHVLAGSAPTTALAAKPNAQSVYVVTYLDFLPDHAAYGIDGMRRYATASRLEPGCARLDILQEKAANHFVIEEVWQSKDDYEAHLASAATLAFRENEGTKPWLGAPYGTAVSRLVV